MINGIKKSSTNILVILILDFTNDLNNKNKIVRKNLVSWAQIVKIKKFDERVHSQRMEKGCGVI